MPGKETQGQDRVSHCDFGVVGTSLAATITAMSSVVQWKRFWCPRGKPIDLSDQGFLTDPETGWGRVVNPDLVAFEAMAQVPCLALLGEPGIGKTWALQREGRNARERATRERGQLIYLDLRSFGSEDRLMSSLFLGPEFQRWLAGVYNLQVFLDSLDECLLRIDNVAALLADELPKYPTGRLQVRIACRTASWPSLLECALKDSFGEERFFAYELAPLRRVDVGDAARVFGVSNPEVFTGRILEMGVASLAIKPITLKFLIRTYLRDGDLPTSQVDLYENGCRILCEESNQNRIGSGHAGELDSAQRLAIAARIAAVTQFTNRYAIWAGAEAEEPPAEDVLVTELAGGAENAQGEVSVTSESIREVLDTGLFSSRGAKRMGWAHQTYAEFLAARYCKNRGLSLVQLRELLFHPADRGRHLVPQLREVAAWLSVIDTRVLEEVIESDAVALLGAAAASLSADQRELVVGQLLGQAESGRPLHLRWGLFALYGKLKHQGLASQLRPYITDKTKSFGVRDVAIEIARACRLEELASDLADIALDTAHDMRVRIPAAITVADIALNGVKDRLRPLVFGEAGEDPDDELKGAALKAVWPNLINAHELFSVLTAPKNRNLSGAYILFLRGDFLEQLSPSEIPTALAWFCAQPRRDSLPSVLDGLMDQVLQLAWDNLELPGMAEDFAAAALSRMRLGDALVGSGPLDRGERGRFHEELKGNDRRRRRVLEELLPRLDYKDAVPFFGIRSLLVQSDFDWIIERILARVSESSSQLEAKLVWYLADIFNRQHVERLSSACESSEVLRSECGSLFEAVVLDSDQARLMRENWKLEQEARAEPRPLVPSPAERVARDLQAIEAGRVERWVYLTANLSLEPTSTDYPIDLEPDLSRTPGWTAADNKTRERVLAAATRYITDADPQNREWFGTTSIPYRAIEGFRALALLLLQAPERVQTLSAETWRKWVPSLIRFFGNSDESKLQPRLLQTAYSLVPEHVIVRLMETVDVQNQAHGYVFVTKEIGFCWDERMAQAVKAKTGDSTLKPKGLLALLQLLLEQGVAGSRELAESLVAEVNSPAQGSRDRALAGVEALVSYAPDAGWSTVWPAFRSNTEFGRLAVETISYADPSHGAFLGKLTEMQLAEFYLWMVEKYPYSQQGHNRVGAMSARDTAVMLRDGILEHLKRRGNFDACEAIREIITKRPEDTWLRHHLEEAESLALAVTWRPASPKQFLAFSRDSAHRLVQTGDELMDVVVQSLDRLHSKLHGELPRSKYLWDSYKGVLRPKDERDLSDYVASHLDEDLQQRGIIVNREVQIRRGIGSGTGQTTDIHVDAVTSGARPRLYERVYVIIEVKGNWNDELLTAMRKQLRDRYLRDNRCQNGLYLVGWFSCAKWDDEDPRKKKCPELSLDEAKNLFAGQAVELSNGCTLKSYVLDVSLTERQSKTES